MVVLAKGALLGGWDKCKYTILETLNTGSYGTVYLARNTRTKQKVAIKQIQKEASSPQKDASELLAIEVSVLTRLRKNQSSNIIRSTESFQDEASHYIVLEYCSLGDLYEVIAADRVPKDTETVRDLVLQLISAVEACHMVGVYHRDIKPENIFLTLTDSDKSHGDDDVLVKLGDFGLATLEQWSAEIGTGSDRYMAPEQFEANASGGYIPSACDIWSLGIVVVNTLFRKNCWKVPCVQDPIFSDFIKDRNSLFDHFPEMSYDTFNVLRWALALDPSERSLAKMRQAVNALGEWTQGQDAVTGDLSRQGSMKDLATYDTNGPTAGRAPLRTPSLAQQQTMEQQSAKKKSFAWSLALAETAEEEPLRYCVQGSHGSASWRRWSANTGSIDSGLGASFESFPAMHLAIVNPANSSAKIFHPSAKQVQRPLPASAPVARIKFPQASKDKEHLKFGMSWADDLDDSEDEDRDDYEEPTWSEDEEQHLIDGSDGEGEVFAFTS